MNTEDKIVIPLNKTKLLLGIIGSILFIILGNWLIINSSVVGSRFSNSFIIGMGLVCVIFFAGTAIISLSKFFSKKPGLQIDANGITDNSNATSLGLIAWQDILSARTEQVMTAKFIIIDVANPSDYINKLTGWKRKLVMANYKKYNSPITISCNTLKTNCSELEKIIQNWIENKIQ